MRRRFVIAWIGLALAVPALAQSPTQEEKQATLAWLHSLQKENGGFAADAKPVTPATLGATSSALRALKYFGGEVKNGRACADFIRSCYDPNSGGMAAQPNLKPGDKTVDVRTTAIGALAALELKLELPGRVWQNLIEQAKTFEEIRIAAAALEIQAGGPRLYAELPWAISWRAKVRAMQNADGSFGKGGGMARDTGGAVVTILRLGGNVEHRDQVLQALKSGQRPDGGWGKEGEKASDLESTYRVMRAFHMLKEKPDVEACRKFVASCRNADGSYSVQPGQPGNVSATYFAGILLHWLDEMK